MSLSSQEDVFHMFRNLSGAKRIEMMCGLLNLCIPLEIRFFETVLSDLTKKAYNSFRDAELKANSRQELEHICKCDLLMEKTTPEFEENETNGNGDGAQNSGPNDPSQKAISKFPSRSKLIISLCLLQPTNHQCSSITYSSIREQLTASELMNTVYGVYIPKNIQVDGLFNEVLLLFTMAIYHPAFSYEERDLLIQQKKEVEAAINSFKAQQHLNALQQSAAAALQPPPQAHQGPPAPNAIAVPPQVQQQQANYANQTIHHQHNTVHTQHPPVASQQVHAYHQYGGPHPQANAPKQQHLTAAHLHPQTTFPISFIQTPVPIANLTYTPQSPQTGAAQVANQTNAVLQNMSILRISSPPSISSTSPSPTISPSSAKMAVPPPSMPNQQPIAIKLENNMFQTATGLPPNSLITFVGDTGPNAVPPGIPYMNLPPQHAVIVDELQKTSSSVSSNTSSASCYNCGNVGHRGGECTSGVDDNR